MDNRSILLAIVSIALVGTILVLVMRKGDTNTGKSVSMASSDQRPMVFTSEGTNPKSIILKAGVARSYSLIAEGSQPINIAPGTQVVLHIAQISGYQNVVQGVNNGTGGTMFASKNWALVPALGAVGQTLYLHW